MVLNMPYDIIYHKPVLLGWIAVIYFVAQYKVVTGIRCDLGNQAKSTCGPDPNKNNVTKQTCLDWGCCYNDTAADCYTPKQEHLVLTYGGDSASNHCYFPFIYKGIAYYDCILSNLLWCGTSNSFDKNKDWSYCTYDCRYTKMGREYVGTVSSSKAFKKCLSWDKSKFSSSANLFPDKTIADASNYCRNPDKEPTLWCYNTAASPRWDFCNVPSCELCNSSLLNTNSFKGTIKASSETIDNSTATDGVTFQDTRRVWGIVTQAVKGESYWTTEYKFKYSEDGTTYKTYQENNADKLFRGNSDASNQAGHSIKTIYAKGFRIYPTKYVVSTNSTMACLKWDLIGCTDTIGCKTNPCQNGGTCIDGVGRDSCQCVAGYTGANCTTDIDDCVGVSCKNGGVCVDGVNNYTCNCPSDYSGQNCENGYGKSCLDIFKSGSNNISTYYNIKFYNGIINDTCEMIKMSYLNINGFINQLPADSKNKVKKSTVASDTGCSELCLKDTTCTVVQYYKSNRACDLWSVPPVQYAGYALTGYSYAHSNIQSYVKQCPKVVSVYCDMTNQTFIETRIKPLKESIRYAYNWRHRYSTYTSQHPVFYPVTNKEVHHIKYDSHSCKQTIGMACRYTYDRVQGFVMADGKRYNLLHQLKSQCSCFLTDVCVVGRSTSCRCRSSQADKGTIYKKSMLPVQAYLFGDVDNYYEYITFTTGELKCLQSRYELNECSSNPCKNGGNCTDGHYSYTCQCVPGYTGTHCETNIDECKSGPCLNKATCYDRVNSYTCSCANGWTGTHCEINEDDMVVISRHKRDIDDCASSPCQNEGSCVDEIAKYRCLCWPGTMGELCELEVDDCVNAPCKQGGTCEDKRNNYTCRCPAGYGGRHCELDIDDCLSTPCRNGATCTDKLNSYTCTCPAGFTSTYCQTEIYECESAPCKNNGNCKDEVAGYTCVCPPGFSGVHCETDLDECISNPCVHGTCQDSINSYMCTCQPGYIGWNCDEEKDECTSTPCQNNATCVDKVDSYSCTCLKGFREDHCDIDINECASNPCQNGGSCKDLVNGYKCNCVAGFTGQLCHLVLVDGQWGGWGPWTQCSVKCGKGVHTRTRSCNNPTPRNGGLYCEGKQAVAEICFSETCADIDGKWGMWGSWSKCSHTCNYGTKVRKRLCDTPPPKGKGRECVGADSSTAVCKQRDCGSPVDGGWSMWGHWSGCTITCGVGASYRTRQCDQPPPVYGGRQCQGLGTNWEPCYPMQCPKYKPCSDWGDWTDCSASCGDGLRMRQRTCVLDRDTVPANATRVKDSTIEFEVEHCEDMPCQEMECYHCSSSFTGDIESLTCKGPTKQCRPDQQYCMYAFSKVPGNNQTVGITKRCADTSECTSKVSTEQCKAFYDQTIDSIITENQHTQGPLEPHPDTLAQMWDALVIQCNICCKSTRCNRGLLPAGNTIYTGTAGTVRQYTIVTVLGVIVTLLINSQYNI